MPAAVHQRARALAWLGWLAPWTRPALVVHASTLGRVERRANTFGMPTDSYYHPGLRIFCKPANAYNPVYGGEAHANFRLAGAPSWNGNATAISLAADMRKATARAVDGGWRPVLASELLTYRGGACFMDVASEGGEAIASGPCTLSADTNGIQPSREPRAARVRISPQTPPRRS